MYSLVHFGIADTSMIDGLQLLNEYRLGILDIAESDGTFAEEALIGHAVNEFVDQLTDALLSIIGQ